MRRLISLFASLALVGGLLGAFAAPVAADSIGTCTSGSVNNYKSGETTGQLALRGVYGEVYLAGAAGPCTPDDNAGANFASVQIGIAENIAGGFVTMGITQCNTGSSSWPAALCDGKYNLYAEQHGSTIWDYNMWKLAGGLTAGNVYDLQISYGCSGHASEWCWFFNGTLMKTFDMGTGLKPTLTSLNASWQVETSDPGDGLGNNVSGQSSGAGRIQYQKNSDKLWYLRSVNGACDTTSGQHRCAANGSYGFYGWTVN